MRVGNSPLLSSRLRRGSSHLEKASLPRQTPRIGSYSNRDASSALTVAAAAAPPSPLLLLAAPSTRCPRSFILYPPPFIQVPRLGSRRCGHRRSHRRRSCPVTEPGTLRPQRQVCVCVPAQERGPLPARRARVPLCPHAAAPRSAP